MSRPVIADKAKPVTPDEAKRGLDLPLAAILATFLTFSVLWAFRIPVPVGANAVIWGNYFPDEGSHIATAIFIAKHHQLPPPLALYEVTVHPPAYHILAGLVYAAGVHLFPAGPPYYASVYDYGKSAKTFYDVSGSVKAVLMVRLLSCLMGTAIVWLTYRAARALASRPTALLAAACTAGVPMFDSLSAGVTNENLSALCAAASLYVMVLGIKRGFNARRLGALTLWMAIGIGTKLTCVGLLPAAWLALWWADRTRRMPAEAGPGWGTLARQLLLVTGGALVVVGAWFGHNFQLYHTPIKLYLTQKQWSVFQPGFAVKHRTTGVSAADYAAQMAETGWQSFWGKFDGMRHLLPRKAYMLLMALQAIAGLGLWLAWRRGGFRNGRAAAAGAMALCAATITLIYFQLNFQHATPQGRYFFPLLLPFGLATAAGWRAAFPPPLRQPASYVLMACFFLLNVYAFTVMSHR